MEIESLHEAFQCITSKYAHDDICFSVITMITVWMNLESNENKVVGFWTFLYWPKQLNSFC